MTFNLNKRYFKNLLNFYFSQKQYKINGTFSIYGLLLYLIIWLSCPIWLLLATLFSLEMKWN